MFFEYIREIFLKENFGLKEKEKEKEVKGKGKEGQEEAKRKSRGKESTSNRTSSSSSSDDRFDGFYHLSNRKVQELGGAGLLAKFGGSLVEALKSAYPERTFHVWRFDKVPVGFWSDESHVQEYLKWLMSELNLFHMEDWYNVTPKQLEDNYGRTLLNLNSSSLSRLLRKHFPSYEWKEEMFKRMPMGHWEKEENKVMKIHFLEKEMGLKEPSEWYRVGAKDLKDFSVAHIFPTQRDLYEVLPLSLFSSLITFSPSFLPSPLPSFSPYLLYFLALSLFCSPPSLLPSFPSFLSFYAALSSPLPPSFLFSPPPHLLLGLEGGISQCTVGPFPLRLSRLFSRLPEVAPT